MGGGVKVRGEGRKGVVGVRGEGGREEEQGLNS